MPFYFLPWMSFEGQLRLMWPLNKYRKSCMTFVAHCLSPQLNTFDVHSGIDGTNFQNGERDLHIWMSLPVWPDIWHHGLDFRWPLRRKFDAYMFQKAGNLRWSVRWSVINCNTKNKTQNYCVSFAICNRLIKLNYYFLMDAAAPSPTGKPVHVDPLS